MNYKKKLKEKLDVKSEKIEISQVTPMLDPKINEALDKFNALESRFNDLKKDVLTTLGIFASFFIFISAEFQILKAVTDFWLLLGFSCFLLSGLLLFALVLTNIVKGKLEWKDFFNPVFVLIFILFVFTILFFLIYAHDP
jgi:hypothetical protein